MTTLVNNPTGDDLGRLLGREDVDFTDGAAQTAVSMAREMAAAYTRGRGFEDDDKVPRSLFHVVLQRAVRLLGNPQQLVSESRDGVSLSYGMQAGQGFTWTETLLLNDFRQDSRDGHLMLNFPDRVTVTSREQYGTDSDTGLPKERDADVLTLAPCAFSVLSAAQHSEAWGDGEPVTVPTVAASLILPGYLALEGALTDYTVRVAGWRGTWRIVVERPGHDWTIYLMTR